MWLVEVSVGGFYEVVVCVGVDGCCEHAFLGVKVHRHLGARLT